MRRLSSFLAWPVWSVAVLTVLSSAHGLDWPGWRGPTRDGYVPADAEQIAKLPEKAKIAWHKPAPGGYASPVVAGGFVFYSDLEPGAEFGNETLHAADAKTGEERWKAVVDAAFKDGFGPGPRCTPLAGNGKVYAQSCKGLLKCFDAASGKVLWEKDYKTDFGAIFVGEKGEIAGAARHGYNGSPLIDGGKLYVFAGGAAKKAGVVCLDPDSGKEIWRGSEDPSAYSPPVAATISGVRQIIYFSSVSLEGLDAANGTVLWRLPLKTRYARHVTTPVISGNTVIVSSHQFGLIGVKVDKDAAGAWSATQAWQNKEAAVNFSSPVAVDGYLYALGSASKIFCVKCDTGEIKWSKGGVVTSSMDKAYCQMMVSGAKIMALTDDGTLVLMESGKEDYAELGRLKVCGQNWCNPAYTGDALYIRDNSDIMRVEMK